MTLNPPVQIHPFLTEHHSSRIQIRIRAEVWDQYRMSMGSAWDEQKLTPFTSHIYKDETHHG